jgi:DTW domain-containing protein YfiP
VTAPGSSAPRPRGFRQARCKGCGLSQATCVCELWPRLPAPLEISVVMSPSEARSASNTARLIALWLPETRLFVRGGRSEVSGPDPLLTRPNSAVLFPGGTPEAELGPADWSSIEHLIVPDGTWSQARRIERRWFAPVGLPHVELDAAWPSIYSLRRGSGGLCTFEAVAIAIALARGSNLACALLERFCEWSRRAQWLKAGGTGTEGAGVGAPEHPASVRLREREARR